jgi:4-hydroxy-3-polyprenylbenzoate decarboxylase
VTVPDQRRIVLAVTGAGGTPLAGSVLAALVDDDRVDHVDLLAEGQPVVAVP